MSSRPFIIGFPAMPLEGLASGIGVYIARLVQQLSRTPDLQFVVFGFEKERGLLDLGPSAQFVPVEPRWHGAMANIAWHTGPLPLWAARRRCDVLFLPAGNRRMTVATPRGVPLAATVHDLAQFHLPEKYDRWRTAYVTHALPLAWRRARLLFAPSQATADDLVRFAGVDRSRVKVVYNGVDHAAFRPMTREAARAALQSMAALPERYILYVARIEHPGKNHIGLLDGYARLRARRPDLAARLVFVGPDWSGAEAVRKRVDVLQLGEYVQFAGVAPQTALPYYYGGADLFAFPSRFEGFGIPAIEAMAAGVPVVAANRASLPEVVGEAGALFDPDDPEAIADALERGLFDETFRAKAREAGPERAARFSWTKTAEETLQSLKRMAER
ncbi:MAG: glycosyltransferase family 1 protein [Myxococcales bacterium]|nr:MAG: glycosyltransferase family 1 protein [Myxococcales bacterium]